MDKIVHKTLTNFFPNQEHHNSTNKVDDNVSFVEKSEIKNTFCILKANLTKIPNFESSILSKYVQIFYMYTSYLQILHQNNSKEFNDKKNITLLYLSRKLSNINITERSNFITLDAGSKCSQQFIKQFEKDLLAFFEKKPNTSIYQNYIDEFFNPINFYVTFLHPELQKDEIVEGIDSQKFAFVVLNKNYYTINNEERKIKQEYQNRFKYMEEVLNLKVILVDEEIYKQSVVNKVSFFKMKLGFDFNSEENIKIHIAEKKSILSNNLQNPEKTERQPKYNLTKSILKKK